MSILAAVNVYRCFCEWQVAYYTWFIAWPCYKLCLWYSILVGKKVYRLLFISINLWKILSEGRHTKNKCIVTWWPLTWNQSKHFIVYKYVSNKFLSFLIVMALMFWAISSLLSKYILKLCMQPKPNYLFNNILAFLCSEYIAMEYGKNCDNCFIRNGEISNVGW